MKTKIKIIAFVVSTVLLFSSCSKGKNHSEAKQAIIKMEVSYKGDIQSQVAVLTFLAVNSNNDLISILNENTGIASAGPFLQNEDFDSSKTISFHSLDKITSASIMLSVSPKVYTTTSDNSLAVTIKIYFDGKLADNQTFSYDQLSDGSSHTPKDFNYTVTVH